MRELAKRIITDAAVAAGIDADSVMDAPDKQTVLLPTPRLELEYLSEDLTRSYRRIAKFVSTDNPATHRTIRTRRYTRRLSVRATVRTDDESALETCAVRIIAALPGKTADDGGNLVTVTATKAVRGGFGHRTVEAMVKRSCALHITVEGMICSDEELPLITGVTLVDGVTYDRTKYGG